MNVFMKAGPLRNGAERGHGKIWHAVAGEAYAGGSALCGATPAIMWSDWTPKGQQVTCKRCLKKLKEIHDAAYHGDVDGDCALA